MTTLPQNPVSIIPTGLVLLALAMGGFTIGTTEFAAMSLLPYFAADLRIDEPTAGHVISAYALGVVVGAPIISVMAARVPRRILLISLMLLFGLANGLSALAPSYPILLLFRFLSGLPHGAYFGVAALVAASLVPVNQRSQAVVKVMLGLTIATIIGVPAASAIGHYLGWRWGFGIVALLALITVSLIWRYAPEDNEATTTSPMQELGALKNRQVWLTLAIGAIGFGGLFAVYTYLSSTLLEVTGVSITTVSIILAIFGTGMTIGNIISAWAADKALMPSAAVLLLWSAIMLAIYPFTVHNIWALGGIIFLIGFGGALATVLQTRLMDVAGDAQTLAAALNHSAFNAANALGPFLGGLAISAGYGLKSTGWVGSGLALGGFAIWCVAMLDERMSKRKGAALQCAEAGC